MMCEPRHTNEVNRVNPIPTPALPGSGSKGTSQASTAAP